MSNNWNRIFTIFVLSLSTLVGYSQPNGRDTPKDNSPYSRLGLGDLVNQNFATSLGYGGLAATFFDYYSLNNINPAANAYLKATAFEIGVFMENSSLKSNTDNSKTNFWNGNLSAISLGFPLSNPINEVLDQKKKRISWIMNFALVPYTTVGYNIEATAVIDGRDTTLNSFQGRGGLYTIQWGNAMKYKNFSAGLNLGYVFGKITNERKIDFIDGNGINDFSFYQDDLVDEFSLGGFVWNAGLMYRHQFKKMKDGVLAPNGKSIIFGLYGNSKHATKTNSSQEYFRGNRGFNIPTDTIRNLSDLKGKATLPSAFGVGLMYENEFKFRLGFDFSATAWDNYSNEAKVESLANTWRVALGGEYIPNYSSYNSQWKRIRYRAGFYYENDPRIVVNQQLTKYALTLGMGIPIILPRSQVSFVNLAFEIGRFGTDNSIQETFFKTTIGFTLNDNTWFFKRKFN